jgi:DNA-directed RNA polymerase specialized sigma24 family protein
MTPNEVLAVIRLRQWAADRAALRAAKTTDYEYQGCKVRDRRKADARLVRVIDFEKALSMLSEEEQGVLLLHYRESQIGKETAKALHCSERKVFYTLPQARKHLADALDRLDLL